MLRLVALLLLRCRAAPTADEWPLVLAGSGKDALRPHCDPTTASDRPCDAMCVREKACVNGPRRIVALMLRGDAFRNWAHQGNQDTCCAGSEAAQRAVAAAHDRLVIEPLERAGYDVRVYISSYHCTNGEDWASTALPALYGSRLRGLALRNRTAGSQWGTLSRAVELAASDARTVADGRSGAPEAPGVRECPVHHAFVLRLDMLVKKFDLCLLAADRPMNRHALDDGGGADQFLYAPGRLFSCVARHRHHPAAYSSRGAHGFLDKIVEFAGGGHKASSYLQAGLGPDAALAKGRDATKCRAFHADWMSKWTAEQAAPRGGLAAARAACYRAPGAFSFG